MNGNDEKDGLDMIDRSHPMVHGEQIEPPFYGTGALITWEGESLLRPLEKEPADQGCITEIEHNSFLDPLGLYGFFPVITDKEQVIILDPSDLMTDQLLLRFPGVKDAGGKSLVDYLRPEGDILCVWMVTLGKKISDRAMNHDGIRSVSARLLENLSSRITLEITRSLTLPAGTGLSIGVEEKGMPDAADLKKLFEYCAIEERMAVVLDDKNEMAPRYSRMGMYFHNPLAKDF